jgi:DNA processing protein
MEATRARAVLARSPALECTHLAALISAAGGAPERALEPRIWREVALPPPTRAFLAACDEATIDADLAWLKDSATRILLCTDPDYPPLLRQFAGAPPVLYLQGSLAAVSSAQLAMVGSRNPTPSGSATAREFAAWFARAGLTVTSGLNFGIDAASHEGALSGGGQTVAVCGGGLDRLYPAEHSSLAARIRAEGALISEVPPRSVPQRRHFERRNRIIGGLCLGVLVVEAARYGAALISARAAAESGREVFAIPGSIHSPLSRGCHQLIKQGAKLVEEAADVVSELRILVSKDELTVRQSVTEKPPALDKEYEMLLDALAFEPATTDVLVARTHLPSQSVASMLLILELEGRVAALPGGRYGRLP